MEINMIKVEPDMEVMENTGLLMTTSDRSVSHVTVSSPQVVHVRDGCATGNATFRVRHSVLPSPSQPPSSQPQMVLTLQSPQEATSSVEFKYQPTGNGTVSPTQSGQGLVESTFSPSQSPGNESSVNDCEPMSSMSGLTQDMDSSGNDIHDEKLSVAADSNSHKQPFVACKVCGDKASGYHYGVTSCEGCKGFFRRSIQKQIEYRCLRDGKCLVMRLNRNRCQYCRFKKCLAVGMSRDSVRYGRVPKRSKSQDEQRVTTTGDQEEINSLESKQLAIYDIILTTSQAHHANCAYTEDKIKTLARNVTTLIPKVKTEADLADDHRCPMFQNMAHLITPSIQEVVEFAKRMPGFHELPQDDQLILIKTGFFEIWLARVARMFSTAENMITFGDGSVVPKEELQVIFTTELVADMFIFAASFSQLQLNDTEIGLFTGVVLATSDRPNLTNVKAVEKIQEQLIEALKLQISRNHGAEPNLFNSMLMKIPELRTVGRKHADQLAWFRDRWFLMRLPPLFAEIYDIQKLDDEDEEEEEVQT